nr:capsid protein [Leptosphaeria biglobosa partitivirus 3]
MAPSKFDISSRATRITAKSNEITFVEVKTPPPVNDFLTLYKSASGTSEGFSNMFTIDCLPNFVPIIMFCIYHAVSFTPQLELRNHAKVSTATVAAYFLAIIYAHILVQDIYLRPQTSYFASDFMDIEYKREFVNYMLHLPVPTFLEPILKKLFITTSDNRPNIVFCPSATGYSFAHHFGRFAPLSFFTHIHYMASSVPSNANVNQVFAEYLTMSTLDVSDPITDTPDFAYCPANILGINMSNNQMHAVSNKFVQSFMSIFNPVLLRATQQRQSFAPVYIKPISVKSSRHNFYDAVFSASPSNLSEYRTLFDSVSATFQGVVPCNSDLAKVYSTISGVDLLVHGYSDFALPTWTATPVPSDVESYTSRLKYQSDEERASTLKFLNLTSLVKSTDDFKYPECTTDPTHKISMTENLVLISKTEPDLKKPVPKLSSAVKYQSSMHFMPRVRVLSYAGSSSANAYMTTLTGMVIEAYELDSSTVPHPDTRIQIGVENSHFLMSGIPYSKARPGSKFDGTNNNWSLSRSLFTQSNPVFTTHLVDSSRIIVPRITEHHAGNLNSNELPGLTFLGDVSWPFATRRFFGGRASLADVKSSNKNIMDPVSHSNYSVTVWSPYSYTSPAVNFEDIDDASSAFSASKQTFFLTNFRTFFGVDIPLSEVSHFLDAMPIV